MKNFDTRAYNIADFLEWNATGLLQLSPDFQRRSVWTEKAKSYLIDTILRGKPIPKILITQELAGTRAVRVVVDGQQRLRAIIDFYEGNFKISSAHNKELGGFTHDRLSDELKREFLQYELGVDLLFNLPYADILDVFARLNSYTVKLNSIEIINAQYLGYFKTSAFAYGRKYAEFLIDSGVITRPQVSRMKEAELSADLFMALIGGVQTNKNVESYYKRYEDEQDSLPTQEIRFDKVMSCIGTIYSTSDLSASNWSRAQLFYTLFTSIAHILYGLTGLEPVQQIPEVDKHILARWRNALNEISVTFDEILVDKEKSQRPSEYKVFVEKSQRATTDTGARKERSDFVVSKLIESL
jgi:hypothetical protein